MNKVTQRETIAELEQLVADNDKSMAEKEKALLMAT